MEKGQATSVDTLEQVAVLAESYDATPDVAVVPGRFPSEGTTSFPGLLDPPPSPSPSAAVGAVAMESM